VVYTSSYSLWYSDLGINFRYLQTKNTYPSKHNSIINSASPLYHKLNILKVDDLYKHECAKIMYLSIHGRLAIPKFPNKFFNTLLLHQASWFVTHSKIFHNKMSTFKKFWNQNLEKHSIFKNYRYENFTSSYKNIW